MTLNEIMKKAGEHLGKGKMVGSAQLCLSDAVALIDRGDFENAKKRALKSIAYSVGILHNDYREATK